MSAKPSSGLLGAVASAAVLLGLLAFWKRRFRWGAFFFRLLVAAGERWRDDRNGARLKALNVPQGGPES